MNNKDNKNIIVNIIMNRIRYYNFKYQVLITPSITYTLGSALMLGCWTDEHLRNYYIVEFDTLGDAQAEAISHPVIDWENMSMIHRHSFLKLRDSVQSVVDEHKFICETHSKLLTASEIKNTMFDRVMYHGKRFSLSNYMNDIITINIVNPFGSNLAELSSYLQTTENLRIFKSYVNNGTHHLVGRNDIGTTYEIVLWPTLIYQWAQWVTSNINVSNDAKKSAFVNALKKQQFVDNGNIIR